MDDIKAKQEIIEKINTSTNILITVSNDPSVDALSAALGLTLLLDKLEKHVSSVFSGVIPPAIAFLEPDKTFDSTTDSLRDFIIALDKEKADHLRYKVEGDSVKIFITPYKTTITSDDLQFSQGDFNVELVIALGVDNQDHLDGALESHGKILHDATIITVTAGELTSTLGGIDWHDAQASSLSEMVVGLGEALKTDKTKSLLDAQISTALLTGIVAETDRFSNTHTTSRVMTTAAQLMATGADQQLIASKLEETHEIGSGVSMKDLAKKETGSETPPQVSKDTLDISHNPNETLEQLDKRVKAAEQSQAVDAASELISETKEKKDDVTPIDGAKPSSAYGLEPEETTTAPTLGGSLNATTEQAAEDSRNEQENDQNKTLLSHAYLDSSPDTPADNPLEGPTVAPGSTSVNDTPPATGESLYSAYADSEPVIEPLSSSEATPPATPSPSPAPADLGLPMPPAVPDFSQAPAVPPVPTPSMGVTPPETAQPERLGDILAPEPDASTPQPPVEPALPPAQAPLSPPAGTPVNPNNPGQFQIPGQQ